MKYYSDLTKKFYTTEEECVEAEKVIKTEEEKKQDLKNQIQETYDYLQDAYDNYRAIVKEFKEKYPKEVIDEYNLVKTRTFGYTNLDNFDVTRELNDLLDVFTKNLK